MANLNKKWSELGDRAKQNLIKQHGSKDLAKAAHAEARANAGKIITPQSQAPRPTAVGTTVTQAARPTGVGGPGAPRAVTRPAPTPSPTFTYDPSRQVSVDGRSLSYRDPSRTTEGGRGRTIANPNAIPMLEPLYQFSPGQINAAAQRAGITNINSRSDVNKVLAQLTAPSALLTIQQAPAPTEPKVRGSGGNTDSGPKTGLGSEIRDLTKKTDALEQILEGITQPQAPAPTPTPAPFDTSEFETKISDLEKIISDLRISSAADLRTLSDEYAKSLSSIRDENAERFRQMQIAQQTQMQNMARGGLTPQFSLGAHGAGPGMYGTGAFRRRRMQIMPTAATGLSIAAAAGNNAQSSNKMLNV